MSSAIVLLVLDNMVTTQQRVLCFSVSLFLCSFSKFILIAGQVTKTLSLSLQNRLLNPAVLSNQLIYNTAENLCEYESSGANPLLYFWVVGGKEL